VILLSRYGFREWMLATALAALGALVVAWLVTSAELAIALYAFIAVAWLAAALFFRDPLGRSPASSDPSDMVSPADGVVSAILEVPHHRAVDGPATIVRIFLSVLDVHINRMPCSGTVVEADYVKGKFLDARSAESAQVNEYNLITLMSDAGDRIGIRQVSGAIARRIVSEAAPGTRWSRTQRFGMIKFGSTTELILPRPGSTLLRVKAGQRVTGGVTILAKLLPASE
jgi:phosphatidylserine decarboxylase